MTEITLQPVQPSELAMLREMVYRYWQDLMPHAPVVQDPFRRAGLFETQFRVDRPDTDLWWGVTNAAKIGFARIERWTNHDGPGATICDLFIEPNWRRQGYGTAFVHAIVRHLTAGGVHRIDLNARADNPAALAFWASVGFHIASYRFRLYPER